MIIEVLGSGTSQGVPVIGCQCIVCTSIDSRDKRSRSSILIHLDDINIGIDIGPDFKMQIMRSGIQEMHGIFITHEHNDHVIGLDELRPFNFKMGSPIPIWLEPRVAMEMRKRFAYAFEPSKYPGLPEIELIEIEAGQQIPIGDTKVEALRVMHGRLPILGFKIGEFAYLTDAKSFPSETMDKLMECKYVIINALHKQPHHAHLNLDEALNIAEQLPAEKIWLTHLSHHAGRHRDIEPNLPERVRLAYDGLKIFM
ncbi:MAG: MBL fold metallo-hydrolase [Saprospiraceae bacterium]